MAMPPRVSRDPKDHADRFWSYVNKTDACWEWTRTRSYREGVNYGRFYMGRDNFMAHKIAWQLTVGPVPDGLCVCHHCDNGLCVRPDHLFLGTHQDNMDDRNTKGRQASGDRNGSRVHPESRLRGADHPFRKQPWLVARGESAGLAKLTWPDVDKIRQLAAAGNHTRKGIAKLFGVTGVTIGHIVNAKTWKPEWRPALSA